jgi:hypothetical protein
MTRRDDTPTRVRWARLRFAIIGPLLSIPTDMVRVSNAGTGECATTRASARGHWARVRRGHTYLRRTPLCPNFRSGADVAPMRMTSPRVMSP